MSSIRERWRRLPWAACVLLGIGMLVVSPFERSVVQAGGPPTNCDSDGDGLPDTGWQCDSGWDGTKDACWMCDTDGDGENDKCAACTNGNGAKICPPCKDPWDSEHPVICYSSNCGVNQFGRATKCHLRGFEDYDDLKENCPGSLQQKSGYTPTANGCGAAGGPSVANDPCGLGTTSFLNACNEHDIGYGTCGSNWNHVNEDFLIAMQAICMVDNNNPTCPQTVIATIDIFGFAVEISFQAGESCMWRAGKYSAAVGSAIGRSAWESAQFESCICCQ